MVRIQRLFNRDTAADDVAINRRGLQTRRFKLPPKEDTSATALSVAYLSNLMTFMLRPRLDRGAWCDVRPPLCRHPF